MKFAMSSLRWSGLSLGAVALASFSVGVFAQDASATVAGPLPPLPLDASEAGAAERFEVVEPYAEMHTAPHRYFPVFFVVKRGEWITVVGGQGSFLRVRSSSGQMGWVLRSELALSLEAAGIDKNLRDRVMEQYIDGRLQIGASIGRLTTETMYEGWARYKLNELLSVQGALSYQIGTYNGSGLWNLNLVAEPWPSMMFSPYAGLGLGQLRDFPQNSSTTKPSTTALLADVRFGLSYRFGEHFGLRVEAAQFGTISSDRPIKSLNSFTIGTLYAF
jgi:hypothetical protein